MLDKSKTTKITFLLLSLSILFFFFSFLKIYSYKRYLPFIKRIPYIYFDDSYGLLFKPNTEFTFMVEDKQIQYSINELGIRDRPMSELKQNQVLVIGDSSIEGVGLHFESTLPQVLEKALSNSAGVQFINAGIRATGTIEEAWQLKRLAPILNPKSVLWSLTENDFHDDYSLLLSATKYDQNGFPTKFDRLKPYMKSDPYRDFYSWLIRLSDPYAFQNDIMNILNFIFRLKIKEGLFQSIEQKPASCVGINEGIRFAAGRNIQITFLIIPFGPKFQSFFGNSVPLKEFLNRIAACIDKNTATLDLRVSEIENNPNLFQNDDMHFNEKGIELAVSKIKGPLLKKLRN